MSRRNDHRLECALGCGAVILFQPGTSPRYRYRYARAIGWGSEWRSNTLRCNGCLGRPRGLGPSKAHTYAKQLAKLRLEVRG